MNTSGGLPGIHGKVPSHGDFITRRLSGDFVGRWDDWLQRAIVASRADLRDRWLDTYLTSPIWSFALGAGICGAESWAGVLMPSVDRVGRYFPLTLAAPVARSGSPMRVLLSCGDWFDRARSVALSSLEEESFSLEEFDASVAGLGMPNEPGGSGVDRYRVDDLSMGKGLCIPLAPEEGPDTALIRFVIDSIERDWAPCSLWWTDGSELVPACVLLARGIPPPDAYAALLNGRFSEQHWCVVLSTAESSVDARALA